jgi:uncharacterized protein (TIGR02118 family)
MYKVVYLLTRRDGMDPEAFRRHWRDVHAPLVSRLPGLLRYTIQPVTDWSDGDRWDVDGIGEAWYQDRVAYLAARDSPEMAAALAARPSFVSHVVTAFVDEEVIVDRAAQD